MGRQLAGGRTDNREGNTNKVPRDNDGYNVKPATSVSHGKTAGVIIVRLEAGSSQRKGRLTHWAASLPITSKSNHPQSQEMLVFAGCLSGITSLSVELYLWKN